MVLKGANWVHNDKIRSNCLESSQLGTICKTIIFKVSWGKRNINLPIFPYQVLTALHCVFGV